jgi:type IV secretion system protein TrbL
MIITGGSAILRSYMEGASGKLKTGAQRLRSGVKMPGRPDLRNNLAGRLRAALDWFSQLPTASRRSILIKGAIAAAVAFVLAMGVVWASERLIGNSLSCGLWSECPEGGKPGIHFGGGGGGASSSLTFGRGGTSGVTDTTQDAADPGTAQDPQNVQQGDPSGTQNSNSGGAVQNPGGGGSSGGGDAQNGGAVTPTPGAEEPVEETPTEDPSDEVSVPATPAPEEPPAEEPVEPQSLTPAE